MSEVTAPYLTHTTGNVPARVVPEPPTLPPLDARTRALVVGLRAVLLMAADVLGDYAGLPKRGGVDSRT